MDDVSRDEARSRAVRLQAGAEAQSLGVFSSFAVAFSYISPSTGIFALFASA